MGYNGKATSPYDADMDSPWNAHTTDLPNAARCGTCRHWAITCDLDPVLLRGPEDRCPAWTEHAANRARVADALAFHASRSVMTNSHGVKR